MVSVLCQVNMMSQVIKKLRVAKPKQKFFWWIFMALPVKAMRFTLCDSRCSQKRKIFDNCKGTKGEIKNEESMSFG